MNLGTWDLLLNVLLLLFWFRIWTRESRDAFFNPQFAPLWRITEAIAEFLRPVFRKLPSHTIFAILFVLVIAMRGALFHALALRYESTLWLVGFGRERAVLHLMNGGIGAFSALSVLSFAAFLFKLWCLAAVYVRTRGQTYHQHASDTLFYLSRPFSDLPNAWRVPSLLIMGILLGGCISLDAYSWSVPSALQNLRVGDGLRLALSTVIAGVQMLPVLQSFAILLIIASWVSMLTASQPLQYFSREWLELVLGPLRRFPLRLGILDLTPLLFIYGLHLVYIFLMPNLLALYQALP